MKTSNPAGPAEWKPDPGLTPAEVAKKCLDCGSCRNECIFLQKYGTPKTIADMAASGGRANLALAFECNLCGLCTEICPAKVDPRGMFLEMRRETQSLGWGDLPEHRTILAYERRGLSSRFSLYALPTGCDTVFFPGCTLPGTRPEATRLLFNHLSRHIPNLGVVLDCCAKPSHDLGRVDFIADHFAVTRNHLLESGVRRVLTACPNCYDIFRRYGGGLSVETVYETLAQNRLPMDIQGVGEVTIHDPCVLRQHREGQDAVRELVRDLGLRIKEMEHNRAETVCCGEGGSACFVAPDQAATWGRLREREAQGRRIITYCAGCADRLSSVTRADHVLDLLFFPEAAMKGKSLAAKSPVTYWNRLRLKKYLTNHLSGATLRERGPAGPRPLKRGLSGQGTLSFLAFFSTWALKLGGLTFFRRGKGSGPF